MKWHYILFTEVNKLYNIQPPIHTQPLCNLRRRDEILIHRLRIGHTHLTHSYLLKQEAQLMLWNARASHTYCALPELMKTHNYNLPVQSIHQIFPLAEYAYYPINAFANSVGRDIGLRIWKWFCVIQANGVSNIDQIWRGCTRCWVQSTVQIWCIYV